jgi:hypothetical protein
MYGIFTNICPCPKSPSFVGKYTSTMEHMGLASTDKSLKLKVHDKDINKILRRSHRLPRLYQKMYGNMRTAMTCCDVTFKKNTGSSHGFLLVDFLRWLT